MSAVCPLVTKLPLVTSARLMRPEIGAATRVNPRLRAAASSAAAAAAEVVWLSAPQVRRRYGGISDMALWRWLHHPTMGFPKPTVINSKRYFRLAEVEAFEIAAVSRRAAPPPAAVAPRQRRPR